MFQLHWSIVLLLLPSLHVVMRIITVPAPFSVRKVDVSLFLYSHVQKYVQPNYCLSEHLILSGIIQIFCLLTLYYVTSWILKTGLHKTYCRLQQLSSLFISSFFLLLLCRLQNQSIVVTQKLLRVKMEKWDSLPM